MAEREIHVVTGAFGFSGKYIARRLLDEGHEVRTLTNSMLRPNPFGRQVKAYPYDFDEPERLADHLQGAKVLTNTYWVRFDHKLFNHNVATKNTLTLFEAAKAAGVKRIVHISITNPSAGTHLAYFQGKWELEQALMESGLSYAILRPAVLFGKEDILINNIAWMLRKLPLFGVFGDGKYRLQPIYVDDLAELAVVEGGRRANVIVNAIGPETFTYWELVARIGEIIGKRRPIVSVSPKMGYAVGALMGKLVADVLITRAEIEGLMADLLYVDAPPTGDTRLTEWARENAQLLGKRYTSELARRRDRKMAYASN